MLNNAYKEMFRGEDRKTKIRPAIVKRDKDEFTVVKKGKNKNEDITFTKYRDKIETVYLIRDGYNNFFNHKPDIVTNALEFHVTYDKNTEKSTGTLYYDIYNMKYSRRIGAGVQPDPDEEDFVQVHEGYECSDLSRYKVQFFPPEINNINALSKYLEHRFDSDLFHSYLIDTIEREGLKQTLREHFELDQNTEILTHAFVSITYNGFMDDIPDDYDTHDYNFGAAFFNNRFVLFKELFDDILELLEEDERLELLECKPTREIRTKDDFDDLVDECSDTYPDINNEENVRENAARFIDNPELFIQAEEGEIIELDMNYKKTLSKKNRESQDPVMDSLISNKLESLALQHCKHFTRRDIGFEYECVDGTKIQHNIQGKQRISLAERRLQFFKTQQLEQQLDNLQNAGNAEFQDNARLHD